LRVAVIYNQPAPSKRWTRGDKAAIAGVMESVAAIKESLDALVYTTTLLGLEPPLASAVEKLRACDADVFFNLFEGFGDDSDTEWQLAEVLEDMGRPFTGAASSTLALCLDKARTKERLRSFGVLTADYQVFEKVEPGQFRLEFPVIVKPAREDASQGCNFSSVVYNVSELDRQVEFIVETYRQPALVELFLPGREFNASILGGKNPRVLPPSEIVYAEDYPGPRILTYASKWTTSDPAYKKATPVCPALVEQETMREIEAMALSAHRIVGAPDYARVDLRGDVAGRLHLLEVNPNPDLSPGAGLALQSRTCEMTYKDLVGQIMELALEGARSHSHDAAIRAS